MREIFIFFGESVKEIKISVRNKILIFMFRTYEQSGCG